MATNNPTPARAKRGSKTAAERAQEALDTANRVVARAEKRLADAKAAVTPLEADLTEATKRRDYLAQNPDLPQAPVTEPSATELDGGTPEG